MFTFGYYPFYKNTVNSYYLHPNYLYNKPTYRMHNCLEYTSNINTNKNSIIQNNNNLLESNLEDNIILKDLEIADFTQNINKIKNIYNTNNSTSITELYDEFTSDNLIDTSYILENTNNNTLKIQDKNTNNNDKIFEKFFSDEETDLNLKNIKNKNNHDIPYCNNCGKYSHYSNECKEPITSYGLICFYSSISSLSDISKKDKRTKKNIYYDNKQKNNDGSEVDKHIKKNIHQVIMVQRKYSIGIIEFMRGKYNINLPNDELKNYLIELLNMATVQEKLLLEQYDNFDEIRRLIGLERNHNYRHEYDDAKQKFNKLKEKEFGFPEIGNGIKQILKCSIIQRYTTEWGLPKGRRFNREYDIDCAIREFVEETRINPEYIKVYKNIIPLKESYKAINGNTYDHIYYVASIINTPEAIAHLNTIIGPIHNSCEISNVQLMTQNESLKQIRDYYLSKKNVIEKGFQIISNLPYYFDQ